MDGQDLAGLVPADLEVGRDVFDQGFRAPGFLAEFDHLAKAVANSGPRRIAHLGPSDLHLVKRLAQFPWIDGSGRVDILDAWALARRLRAPANGGAGMDVNGDGRVDRGDVDAVAMVAVRLDRGTTR